MRFINVWVQFQKKFCIDELDDIVNKVKKWKKFKS